MHGWVIVVISIAGVLVLLFVVAGVLPILLLRRPGRTARESSDIFREVMKMQRERREGERNDRSP